MGVLTDTRRSVLALAWLTPAERIPLVTFDPEEWVRVYQTRRPSWSGGRAGRQQKTAEPTVSGRHDDGASSDTGASRPLSRARASFPSWSF